MICNVYLISCFTCVWPMKLLFITSSACIFTILFYCISVDIMIMNSFGHNCMQSKFNIVLSSGSDTRPISFHADKTQNENVKNSQRGQSYKRIITWLSSCTWLSGAFHSWLSLPFFSCVFVQCHCSNSLIYTCKMLVFLLGKILNSCWILSVQNQTTDG